MVSVPRLLRSTERTGGTEDSWEKREQRYCKKFDAGRKYIPELFRGTDLPSQPDQIMLIGYGKNKKGRTCAGGSVMTVGELLQRICNELKTRSVGAAAVPESFPLLRGIQFLIENRGTVREVFLRD